MTSKNNTFRHKINEITARLQRDYGSLATRLRLVTSVRSLRTKSPLPTDRESTPYELFRTLLFLFVVLCTGIGEAWAQTDYSGVWYIASNGKGEKNGSGYTYNSSTPSNNFYICPTEDWCYYKPDDDFSDDGETYPNPFLTTYKCRSADYHSNDASDAVWEIIQAPNSSYYYIIQKSTGRYLVSNGQIRTSNNPDRIRVHLEKVDDPTTLGDKVLFDIVKSTLYPSYTSCVEISPKGITDGTSTAHTDHDKHKWLTVNNGNYNYLTGQSDKTGGPTGYEGMAGIVCLYTKKDQNGSFTLEPAITIVPPTITNNYDGTFTITAATGAIIYYTTDGTTPTTETTTTGTTSVIVNQTPEMTVIKAIAQGASDFFPTTATTYNIPACQRPTITASNGTVTITCATEGADIHYTTDGSHATASSTLYSGPFAKGSASEIRAIATKTGYLISSEAALLPPTEVSSSSDITDMSGNYILTSNFTQFASVGSASEPFCGTIDGDMITLSGLRHPLVAYANDAIIKNVMLKDVVIDGSSSVGAIVGVAEGYSRIYNCGILPSDNKYENETSHLSSSDGYCGGLVGWLKDDSRVINCFSYANIEGGTDVAGIVGHVEAITTDENGSYASTTEVSDGKYYRLKTAVVNCMFYGDISGGSNRYPVYGGAKMLNNTATGINNYDFYRAEATVGTLKDYNCSWPAKEEYLTQYEFYRYLLNSNRELCGWWVGAPSAPSAMTTTEVQDVPKDASLMAKWVLDPSIAPYPILKPAGKYPSVINQAPEPATTAISAASALRIDSSTKQWVDRASSTNTEMVNPKAAPETDGRILGTIKVNISDNNGNSQTRYCAITAMDIDNNDFCYGKIQLPYYNSIFGNPNGTTWVAKYGGNYTDNVVIGWTLSSPSGKIIPSISNKSGTDENGIAYDHTFSTNAESGYNFADRYCTTKDQNRTFAQGGYYYVPYGVSEITITAKWASAIYLDNKDHYYDCISVSNYVYEESTKLTVGSSTLHPFEPAGTRLALGNGEEVKTGSISANLPNGSVYEKAIVLVGNHQYFTGNADMGTAAKGCTIMSADFDFDDEPDNCLIWQLGTKTNRFNICPIRFDFLPVVEMGLAMKEKGSTHYYALGCYRPLGHYEATETSLIHFGQFEFGNSSRTAAYTAPLILNGGIYDQYTKGTMGNDATKDYINYIIIGGNVRIPSFTPGAHPSERDQAKKSTRHCPVNVIGGNIDYLYLSGNYNDNIKPSADNPHCYIDGGNFKQVAAAGKEGINGNVFFNINHSIIQEFYGGSTMDQADGDNFKIVKGNIDVTVDNSMVTKYCGGPKFGSMVSGKTVTTRATGTTFEVYYGGGNGGTSYVQYTSTDITNNSAHNPYNWEGSKTGNLTQYTPGAYYKKNESDAKGMGYKADYDMEIVNASSGTVPNQGIFRAYFYTAQFSATNTGPVTNNLTDCKVLTNFYGGGNLGGVIGDVKSTLTNTEVLGSAFGAGYSASVPEVTIHNKDKTPPTLNIYTGIITPTPEGSGSSKTYTWTNKTSLGGKTLSTSDPAVENVDGKNYFYTEESLDNLGTVSGEVTLNIEGTTTVGGNIYGGGEESGVGGSTQVFINNTGTAGTGNVFGAGKGLETDYSAALVKGNSSVMMSAGHVKGNIYGGGELSSVGTFTFNTSDPFKISSWENNTGKTTITISGGTVGNSSDFAYDAGTTMTRANSGNVFAGSKGILEYSTGGFLSNWYQFAKVKETELTISGGAIMSNIYGGGELGSVGYINTSDALVGGTIVTVSSGTIGTEIKDGNTTKYTVGSVFGGGYGSDIETTSAGTTDEHAPKLYAGKVYGNTSVTMTDGAVKASVYGGGQLASVDGNATVAVSGGTIGIPKAGDKQFGGATMGNVYGGGSGDKNIVRAGQIFGNTNVNISQAENKTTRIYHNIYGGGAYGSVGTYTYTYTTDDPNYQGIAKVNGIASCAANTGTATVTIIGGTIGADGKENGMIFGSSRGDVGAPDTRDDLVAWVNTTEVTIGETSTTGPVIKGSVYGSGENGHTHSDAVVTVNSGTIGIHDGTNADSTRGNVYGAGCGTDKYYSGAIPEGHTATDGDGDSYNPKAGIVQGTATVTINGGHVLHNVYGAGAMGPVGIDGVGHMTTVNINGGRIGYDGNDNGYVFGGARGAQGIERNFAYVGDTEVNINYTSTPDADNSDNTEQLITGSVFGGGEAGSVHGSVVVNMNKGLVVNDVYGGGALADTNTDNWGTTTWASGKTAASNTTTVNLKGGKVNRNVYGGGLGQTEDTASGLDDIEAKVYGNVLVELNNDTYVSNTAKGCVVLGSIFGCNNLNGTPMGDVKVHVYKTQHVNASKISGTDDSADADHQPKVNGRYDLAAVYGGGNQSAYDPADPENNKTEVIIDGCELTSIQQVYGGGNAACTPATNVTVNGTFEINELFGGGNGLDNILINGVEMPNPGANVGYKNYSEYYQKDGKWLVRDMAAYDTKEERMAATNLVYGTGKAAVNIFGGTVHHVFGGSNTKGNVRRTAVTLLEEQEGEDFCPFKVDEAYGGGKSAMMDAEAQLLMACIPGLQAVYGGAEAADVHGNVTLNITNGTFDRVFGGNNLSGTIGGAITINVEEIGCRPVKIGELYGGGNQAGYSVYGYNSDGTPKESGTKLYDDPLVNVMSFTSIGNIYGGGYGDGATMVGNPTVNVNVAYGRYYDDTRSIVGENAETPNHYPIPSHAKGKMGAISNVFGGGNAAKVIGNTHVNIGTVEEVYVVKQVSEGDDVSSYFTLNANGTYSAATGTAVEGTTYYEKKTVLGADIRGNVYGGGNNAEVIGDAKVKIGKKNEGE